MFAAWLAILSRGPTCERWRSFANFYSDVGKRPTWRHLLIRDDPAGEFEPGNARWQVGRPKVSMGATDRTDTLSLSKLVSGPETIF